MEEAKKKVNDSKNNSLRNCFSALVDRKQVNLELDVLKIMLIKEIGIQLDTLEPELFTILPYLLVHFIRTWPGWSKSIDFYSGKISFKVWYDKFYKFLCVKLNEAMSVHYKEVKDEQKQLELEEILTKYSTNKIHDKNTQTDNTSPKSVAPFTIDITAGPEMINTIVFTDTPEGDVILKQHKALEWDQKILDTITLQQLITWPHVGVLLKTPIFTISRKNFQHYERQLSLPHAPLPNIDLDFITSMKLVDPAAGQKAYTVGYIEEFKVEFLEALKNVFPNAAIIESFQTVIDEFVKDIVELDVQRNGQASIGTNTAVLFNIGKCIYLRNKKISRASNSNQMDIAYTELIKPQMEITFTMGSEEEIDKYIEFLQQYSENSSQDFEIPHIVFSCTFCNLEFENGGQTVLHLKNEHKMERPMMCVRCKQNKQLFNTFDLSMSRWTHACKSRTSL